MNFESCRRNQRAQGTANANRRVNMKTIIFIDKKWQSSVTACVRVYYEDGSRQHYLQGRYGGSALTETDYDEAKPYRAGAWKRYRQLPEKQGLRVEVIPLDEVIALEPETITKSEVVK